MHWSWWGFLIGLGVGALIIGVLALVWAMRNLKGPCG